MVLSRICALLCLGCLLAGCGTTRPVVVVEKDEFIKMAHNMPKELQARDLLDKDRAYTAPMSFKGLKQAPRRVNPSVPISRQSLQSRRSRQNPLCPAPLPPLP